MRNYRIHILFGILLSWGISQPDIYRSIEDVEKEWTGYTSFQKEEMISFCDFFYLTKVTTRGAFLLHFKSFINFQTTHLYRQFNITLQGLMRRWRITTLPLVTMLK